MAQAKITKELVEGLEPDGEDLIVWDTRLPKFGVRVRKSGRKSYVVKYRTAAGRQRWITIGEHGSVWTPIKARKRAETLLGEVAADNDPAQRRDEDRAADTIKQLSVSFMQTHVEVKRKPRTATEYQSLLDRFILPKIGARKPDDVTHVDIEKLHYEMRQTPRQANHMLSVVSKMFNWGRLKNPAAGIERYQENQVERYLSAAEMYRLGVAITESESEYSVWTIAALRTLIFTGARRGEVLNLLRAETLLDRGIIAIGGSKADRQVRKAKIIYLNAPAIEVLASVPEVKGNPYMFPGVIRGRPLSSLQHPWERIREKAGLEDVRLHDLRHSFGELATSGGQSLRITGALLGHRHPATTQRYAHVANHPAMAASQAIGERIASIMKGETAEIEPLPPLKNRRG